MAMMNQPTQKSIWAKARAGSDISAANRKRVVKMRARAKQRQSVANGRARARCRRRQQKKARASVGRDKKADR
jgi:hypothetical protein